MEEKDYIKELFSEKLGNAEAPVNPELWSAISSNLASSSAVSTGLSLTTKWLIGLGIASASVFTGFLLTNDNPIPTKVSVDKNVSKSENRTAEILTEESKTFEDDTNSTNANLKGITNKNILDKQETQTQKVSEASNVIILPIIEPKEQYVEAIKPIIKEENKISTKTTTEIKDEKIEATLETQTIVSSKESFIGELPNVFTPNNDRENDIFFIESKELEDFVLTVLNSKNEVVFKTNNPNFKWDGKDFSSNLVPTGAYVYFFTAKDSKGNPISKYSNLQIRY